MMTTPQSVSKPVTCEETDLFLWNKRFSTWVTMAKICNRYMPRGKSFIPRVIGKVFGKGRRECIQTRGGAFLAIEPTSLDVYALILNQGGVWNTHVLEACTSLLSTGQVFYDIGANVGFMSIEIANTFQDGVTVISFEPQKTLSRKIALSAKLNNLRNFQVFDLMVGATRGESELYLSSHSIHASSIAREKNAVEVKSSMTTIDELVSTRTIPPPDVMKLDIEGGELSALQGAKETIIQHQPSLVFESDENMNRFGYSRIDVLEFIRKLGSYDFFFVHSSEKKFIPITDSNISDRYTDILAKANRARTPNPLDAPSIRNIN